MNRFDFPYDETYLPAMPILSVAVDGYAGFAAQQVTALVDSGADGTMIPVDVLEMVGALYEDTVIMRGVLGVGEAVDRYTVAIQLGSLSDCTDPQKLDTKREKVSQWAATST